MNAVIILGAGGLLGKNLKEQLSTNILYKNYSVSFVTELYVPVFVSTYSCDEL